jgi:biopolymer transport protein ExbB
VLAYNWLIRRNKSIMEDLAAFTNDLHGFLMSDGRVKPKFAGAPAGRSAAPAAGTAPRGTEPRRPEPAPTADRV